MMIPPFLGEAISTIAGLFFAYRMFQNYFPVEILQPLLRRRFHKLKSIFNPYIEITFPEYQADQYERSFAYAAIERYLNINSVQKLWLPMTEGEGVADDYKDVKLWWQSNITTSKDEEIRYYMLIFPRNSREIIINEYLDYVLGEGKAIEIKERQRKLYTNIAKNDWDSMRLWTHVVFKHPASFENLAMEPIKKQEIIDDLMAFSKAKDYYAKIGKAWKRGYLLYGPPRTGKSTMIAAMANLLNYDIYDLKLTAVKDNTQLRKLLIGTSGKSIIVIEDIECTLDVTGKEKKWGDDENTKEAKVKKDLEENKKNDKDDKDSNITLSRLFNFIDGLWSACGDERIIIFTTNHVEKLDPALIRSGRMDKHIELSYCGFEAFKILASNYLSIDSHDLFKEVKVLLDEIKITPADVAENLMPKSSDEDAETCLLRLIKAFEEKKLKEEEKEKLKTEQEKKRRIFGRKKLHS